MDYHTGSHACEPKKTAEFNEEGLKKKFETNPKTTPRQAADDIIVNVLVNEDMLWEDVHNVVDSVIEEERMKYCKKKDGKRK